MLTPEIPVPAWSANGRNGRRHPIAKPQSTYRKELGIPLLILLVLSLATRPVPAAAPANTPQLFRTSGYGAPVRGGPDDLLFLPGYGLSADDAVVYSAVDGNVHELERPEVTLTGSTATSGIVEIISADNVPYSLTVKLPTQMRPGQPYAIWVRNAEGTWSDPVFINDARPLWVSPPYALDAGAVAGLPRSIKVIGRNLDGASGSRSKVRLVGPETIILDSTVASASTAEFVAESALPAKLTPGKYQVSLSRDGKHWTELRGQQFEVRPRPGRLATFRLDDAQFGGCKPDDQRDDTGCLAAALKNAAAAGGGRVELARGTWRLGNPDGLGGDGLVLAKGVSLVGVSAKATTLLRGANWALLENKERPSFTLLGNNEVSGLRFADERRYTGNDRPSPVLRLGYFRGESPRGAAPNVGLVENLIIAHNIFDRSIIAIADSGAPIRELTIANNIFGSFRNSLSLGGNRFQVHQPFRLEDSLIRDNVFKPGSYVDARNRQGTIAAELGAARRVDFSGNIADGADTEFLYAPTDAPGWRAAFFWHLNNNQEMVLVSDNKASCTGDKAGDGEAFAFDNNGNTFALDAASVVTGAGKNTVSIAGPLLASQSNRELDVSRYYVGHWIFVGDGPGVGQARKIAKYVIDKATGGVTFTVSPGWDVVPVANISRIDVGRTFWQLYVLGNAVDHRVPVCRKGNASDIKGGGISLWAQATDSAISGNTQMDTDGIVLHPYTADRGTECTSCEHSSFAVFSSEIRANEINGEYDDKNDCSPSGIALSAGTTQGASRPLAMAYGLSIAHNQITRADAEGGGSIALSYSGPPRLASPLVIGTMIYGNTIIGARIKPLKACRRVGATRATAIQMGSSRAIQKSVLSQNNCPGARTEVAAEPFWGRMACTGSEQPECGCRH